MIDTSELEDRSVCSLCEGGHALADGAKGDIPGVNPVPLEAIYPVPKPRHAWKDVAVCPECDRAYLLKRAVRMSSSKLDQLKSQALELSAKELLELGEWARLKSYEKDTEEL